MRVFFEKDVENNRWKIYCVLADQKIIHGEEFLYKHEMTKLKWIINKTFPEAICLQNGPISRRDFDVDKTYLRELTITFKDDADEAFFIVWASDGVEI
jgi:hypothetical protein